MERHNCLMKDVSLYDDTLLLYDDTLFLYDDTLSFMMILCHYMMVICYYMMVLCYYMIVLCHYMMILPLSMFFEIQNGFSNFFSNTLYIQENIRKFCGQISFFIL